MKSIFTFFVMLLAAAAGIIAAAVMLQPVQEISIIDASNDAEAVISWNISGQPVNNPAHNIEGIRRHISFERYISNDINDAVRITIDRKAYKPEAGGGYSWTAVYIEAFKNTDEAWINLSFGF